VTGCWRKIHTKELHTLHQISESLKSRMRWVESVVCIEVMNPCKIFFGKTPEKRPFKRPRHMQKKVKQSVYMPWRRLGGGRRYSSYSFTTSALNGGEWSASRPGQAYAKG
jgi:hypothetical protein